HVISANPFIVDYDNARISVEQYFLPIAKARQDVSFIITHANGFNKEMYQPIYVKLVNDLRKNRVENVNISMFSVDSRFHGESARLNQHLNFSNCKHIYVYKPIQIAVRWANYGFDTKQVVDVLGLKTNGKLYGLGHCVEGSARVLINRRFPDMFNAICLIDPFISDFNVYLSFVDALPFYSCIKRKDEWLKKKDSNCVEICNTLKMLISLNIRQGCIQFLLKFPLLADV
ncbi:hypothetical protein BY458DRAFT_428471, partial [Sporodiniella umbellata]